VEPRLRTALAWRRHPDVVLFVLESFRADALGRIVNGVPVTPVLDELARQGVSSSLAFSHNGYTAQSRYHLLTGSLAGLRDGSLIDDFTINGYQTAYFSGQDESFGGPAFGIGFERAEVRYDASEDPDRRYSRFTTAGSLAVPHSVLQEQIDAFLAARTDERPLFLYVNFHDTHFPYHHDDLEPLVSRVTVRQSRIAPARADAVREMYFNAAANVDRALGRTLDAVTRALGRTPAVVVTADHGESLFDEGFLGHGYALNDVQTRIPLIVRGLPMEIGEPFGQVELRDAIGAALSRDPADGDDPRLFPVPGKEVFQYLGNIHRPRQIALASGDGRLIYDFRSRLVHMPGGAVHRASGLDGDAPVPFLQLVHYWERMMLARAAGGAATGE
jgi:arylsulfatase A-like enzyme